MYSYKPKGEWIDCNKCGGSHRRILQSDIEHLFNADGTVYTLTEETATQCPVCAPIEVFHTFNCPMCENDRNQPKCYGAADVTKCNVCGFDQKDNEIFFIDTNSGVKGRDWHKGLNGDWKDFKRQFKRRHNNGDNNLPDY